MLSTHTLKLYLFIILHPSYWVRNEKYSPRADRLLNAFMNENLEPIDRNYYELMFEYKDSIHRVWIQNHPYAFGSVANNGAGLPGRITALKFYNRYC